jgi:serine protease Do
MKLGHAMRWTEMNVSRQHGCRGDRTALSDEKGNCTPFRSWVLMMVLCVASAPGWCETPSLVEVFKRVNPAVVEIHTQETDLAPEPEGRPVKVTSLGSGVLISRDGKVLTAAHLVQAADAIEVEFATGEKFRAEVASSDPDVDLACLQLEGMPRVPFTASLGDSDSVEVGALVFVIGAPLGLSHTLTVGHISGHHRPDTAGGVGGPDLFQTDAAINQGNSGGPMFDMDGKVIGIVSHILSMSGGSEGLGFAVTSNTARRLLEEKSIWTGLDGHILTGDLARALNIPPPGVGLLVQRIAAGSPAELSGLRGGTMRARIGDEDLILGGDIVLSVMGISVDQPDYLAAVSGKVAVMRPGQEAKIVVLRGGTVVTLTSTLPSRE